MAGLDDTRRVLLALQCVCELSNKKRTELLEYFDNPCDALDEIEKRAVFSILGDEHATEFFKNVENADSLANELEKRDIRFLSFLDDAYPQKLFDIYDKPTALFVKGNLGALERKCVSVVGTRRPTRYGAKVADEFSREFSKAGVTIISGLARGIDGIAHLACVNQGNPTVAVFASGLDVIYPAEHRSLAESILANDGLLLSEYPLGTKPLQYHFPERNRIVSGLADAVFLPQAAKKSGSLITMRLAIEQGKDVFIAPGNIYDDESAGGNELLREIPHAIAITPEDVLDQMGVSREEVRPRTVELSIVQTQILDALHDGERHFEELIEATGLGVSELTSVLFDLEIEGLIFKGAGNFYSLA